jgi:hypothetical protein
LLLPLILGHDFPLWPWITAVVFAAWSLIAPARLRTIHRGWFVLGLLLSRIMSPVIMALVYYLVVTPMGLVRRLLGHGLPMERDVRAESYRVKSRRAAPEDLERPF